MRADLEKKSRPPQPFHRGGANGATNSPVACSQGQTAVEQIGFPQAIHGGRTMVESIFRNLLMMSRWLRSVFVKAVRGLRDRGGAHLEVDTATGAGAPESGGIEAMALHFEFLKNTINIDKFPKLFSDRTNDISNFNIVIYQYILKYYIIYFRKFIELKKFFRTPHFPAFATRSASGRKAPDRAEAHLPGRAPWPASRSRAPARCPKARARCRSRDLPMLPPR